MGRQREGTAQLELRDESSRGSHRPRAVDGRRCRDQYGFVEQRRHDKRCPGVCSCNFVSIMLAELLTAPQMLRMAGVWRHGRCSFKHSVQKTIARLVVMMLEVLAFPLDMSDVVNSLETMERKIKVFERHANIEIPKFLKIYVKQKKDRRGRTSS